MLLGSAVAGAVAGPEGAEMGDETTTEVVEHVCAKHGRTARLVVQWKKEDGEKRLVGVECDNPKFAGLDHFECDWSCWEEIEQEGPG